MDPKKIKITYRSLMKEVAPASETCCLNINNKVPHICVTSIAHLRHRLLWYRKFSFLPISGRLRSGGCYKDQIQAWSLALDQYASSKALVFKNNMWSVTRYTVIAQNMTGGWSLLKSRARLSRDPACVVTDRCHARLTFESTSECSTNLVV